VGNLLLSLEAIEDSFRRCKLFGGPVRTVAQVGRIPEIRIDVDALSERCACFIFASQMEERDGFSSKALRVLRVKDDRSLEACNPLGEHVQLEVCEANVADRPVVVWKKLGCRLPGGQRLPVVRE
jgi:hypothetical protein